MTRTERDLRAALHELERHADQAGGPSVASLVAAARGSDATIHDNTTRGRHGQPATGRRGGPGRWLVPMTAAAAVAAAAVIVAVTVDSTRDDGAPVGNQPSAVASAPATGSASAPDFPRDSGSAPASSTDPSPSRNVTSTASQATAVLDRAATLLDSEPFTAPDAQQFYYVRTTDATTWTSVSGRQEGRDSSTDGTPISVPGCVQGQIVARGEAGPCTLDDVPHYRADAPTSAGAWDDYLEGIAPGAKAAQAQGKIIVQVLHGDLISPQATAALLRYTAMCEGLHTFAVKPVDGRELTGVTCTSMTNGAAGLVFDDRTHAYVGIAVVNQQGEQDSAAVIVQQTGIVDRLGQRP